AVNGRLRSALAAAVRQAERDPEVRVVVVTGSGSAFCAGADVREFQGREGAVEEIRTEYERILTGLRTMPKPTIAAINGVAAGMAQALGAMKRSVNFAATATLEEAIDFEFMLQGVMMEGADFRERVRAFLERRA